uniref:Transposase domain-containing protein n=1 Tax=Trichogramma kaykai TaxID=54128 RepID=A0ABD2XJY6_9HYME
MFNRKRSANRLASVDWRKKQKLMKQEYFSDTREQPVNIAFPVENDTCNRDHDGMGNRGSNEMCNRNRNNFQLDEDLIQSSIQNCRLSDSGMCKSDDEDSSSCEESDDDDIDNYENNRNDIPEAKILTALRTWAMDNVIPYGQVDSLLQILKPFHPELPLTSKTLFKKRVLKKNYCVQNFNPEDENDKSEFVYYGMKKQLERIILPKIHKIDTIKLQFNIDGLPLYNSSATELYPILGKIYRSDYIFKPFIVAIFCGKGKPKNIDNFFSQFVQELNILLKSGITIKEKLIPVELMCFICDMPARAMIKCTKGHTGFEACERCTVHEYKDGSTIYPVDQCIKRSDESFRKQVYPHHHNSTSPLTHITLPVDMIKDFVLDFMHLGSLGIMKKLLVEYWMKPKKVGLPRQEILRISQRLVNLSCQIPEEFQRTTRSLGDVGK